MTRSIYLLLLASVFIYSCVSKKYGRHFQNQIGNHQITQQEIVKEEKPQLVASIDSDVPIIIQASEGSHSLVPVLKKIPSIEHSTKSISNLSNQSKGTDKKNKKSEKIRKLEPYGLGAFGLFVITSLIGISTGFTPLLFVLFGLSMVAGLFSVHRISIDKKRWKGRFFGYFVVIVGLTLLTLLGISAFIDAVLGDT
ncbi:MAG: hypothetical protein ABJH98_06910 [Reichenbachiella sp.]|uniref:hypothetical protein n=1 Tax=Reichenbachiella sp. TaxID=2184521 RepID=UPI0032981D1F